jgi:hypothetical protein
MSSRYEGRVLDVAELLAAPPDPQPWIVERFAAPGAVTVLTGGSGIGKSALAVSLAATAQAGVESVAGLMVAPVPSLVIDGEQGRRVIARRLQALAGVPGDLGYLEASGLDVRRGDDRAFLLAQVNEGDRRLIVSDSLRRLAPGAQENSSDEMALVMEAWASIAQESDAAVVLIHHRGKADASGQAPDLRGSEAIRDVADALFVLEADRFDPMRAVRRRLRCAKMRLDEAPPTRWLSIGPDSEGRLAVRPAGLFDADALIAGEDPRDELRGSLLAELTRRSPMRRADLLRAAGKDPKNKSARNLLDDLEAEGRLASYKADSGEVIVHLIADTGAGGVRGETPADTPSERVSLEEGVPHTAARGEGGVPVGTSPRRGDDPRTPSEPHPDTWKLNGAGGR